MHRFSRRRPTPSMIVAWVALFVALGGTSYAAIILPANSVGTKQLKANAATGAKVKNGSLTTADISAKSLSTLGRVAIGSGSTVISTGTNGTVATVSLTEPKQGFVLVNGYVDEDSASGIWGMTVTTRNGPP